MWLTRMPNPHPNVNESKPNPAKRKRGLLKSRFMRYNPSHNVIPKKRDSKISKVRKSGITALILRFLSTQITLTISIGK